MSNEQIKHMVDRFLQWKLPENFNPDGGISFKKTFNEHAPWGPMTHEPVGTNLFDAVQAEAMVRYMVDGLPAELGEPAAEPQPEVTDGLGSVWPPCDKHKRSLEVVRPGDARCPDCEYEKHVQRASGRSLADKDLQLNRHPVRAPAPAAPLLSALDVAKKLVNAGGIDGREKILKQSVDSYIARWAAELEQVRAERDRFAVVLRDIADGQYGTRAARVAAEAALGEKGKQ